VGQGVWPGRSVGVGTRGSGVKACAGKGVGLGCCEGTDRLQPGASTSAKTTSATASRSTEERRLTRRILSRSLSQSQKRLGDGRVLLRRDRP
jgi:hypothetical protein